jgi:MHS family proline/betaine transporter-like MFS transporter
MFEWGWRIPFLLALPLGIIGLWMRLSIEDSPEFESKKDDTAVKKGQPFAELISTYPRALFKVILISLVQNIGTYIGTVFIAAYFSSILGYTKGQASTIVLIAVILAAFLIPLAGQLGSYRGAKSVLRLSYLAYAVLSVPSFMLMQQGSVNLAIAGLALGMIPYALCQAGTYSVMPEFFPMHIRHTGVAFGHSVGAVIGGGAGPYFATWLIGATGNQYAPAYILCVAGLIGLIVISTVRKNASTDQDTTTHQYS